MNRFGEAQKKGEPDDTKPSDSIASDYVAVERLAPRPQMDLA